MRKSKCSEGKGKPHDMPNTSGFPIHLQIGEPCDCFEEGDTWMDVMDPERMARRAAERGSYIVTSWGHRVGDSFVNTEGPSFGTPPDWWDEFQRGKAADDAAREKAEAAREAADWAKRHPKAKAAAWAPAAPLDPVGEDMSAVVFDALFKTLEDGSSAAFRTLVKRNNAKMARSTDGLTCLHLAVLKRDRQLVAFAVENGADLEARDHRKRTPLLQALAESRYLDGPHNVAEIVDALVELGADVNVVDENKNSCLHLSITNTSCGFETPQLLIRKGARPLERNSEGATPCKLAVVQRGSGYSERLIKLIKNKCNLVDPQALVAAAEIGQMYLIKVILDLAQIANTKSGLAKSVLYTTICNRKNYDGNASWLNTLRILLSNGADPIEEESEYSPILGIARYGNKDSFKLIMSYCADVKHKVPSKDLVILAARENADPKMLKFLENYFSRA
ncbi:hypothetical protein QAD02_020190 [Eretmocerus hayati]|uniref:Uncharacterized protein n=1 Tax=Eretmocerus hayati TaxID=131215 RepID=A0ACC2PLS8_9HYME|nr:hypothetical protein QAD02_020190 [Eretmocerus hayati]